MSLVVDASAVVAALTGADDAGREARGRLARAGSVAAPHLIDPEVLNALRRLTSPTPRRHVAVVDFRAMPLDRYAHGPLLSRMWQLRANVTGYDAAYLALAEALGWPLLTVDGRLARAPGHRADVVLVAS